jgi:hypothetical protein
VVDQFGTRILGTANWHPTRNDELMRTLFPPVHADLLTFYLP